MEGFQMEAWHFLIAMAAFFLLSLAIPLRAIALIISDCQRKKAA